MRDGRAEDEDGVIPARREQAVEVDLDGLVDEAARQLADALGGEFAEVNKFRRVVPLVVEDVSEQRERGAFAESDLRALLLLCHRHVRALRDERVELSGAARGEDFGREGEEDVRVVVARLVGDDGEHARAGADAQERLLDDGAQLLRREVEVGRPLPDS